MTAWLSACHISNNSNWMGPVSCAPSRFAPVNFKQRDWRARWSHAVARIPSQSGGRFCFPCTCFMIAIEHGESAVKEFQSLPFYSWHKANDLLGTKPAKTPVEKAGIWLHIVRVHSDASTRASTCALGVMKAKNSHNSRSLNFSPKCSGLLAGKRFTSTSDSPQRPFPGEPAVLPFFSLFPSVFSTQPFPLINNRLVKICT